MSTKNTLKDALKPIFEKLSAIPTVKHGDTIDPQHHNDMLDAVSELVDTLYSFSRGVYSLDILCLTPLKEDPPYLRPGMMWFIYVPEQNKAQIRFTPDGRNIYTIWSL
jgi:hypothetical protein